MSSDEAVKVHKFLDGGKVHSVRNKTFKGKPRLVKPVCGGAQMKYSVKHPVKKKEKDQTNNKKKKEHPEISDKLSGRDLVPPITANVLFNLPQGTCDRKQNVFGSRPSRQQSQQI